MNRQVDVKALVSHIVRGDGLDKCRICMGDTSQGQVHLSDTVMMDGDKAVTLSELLELITGVQVVMEEGLPAVLCVTCSTSVKQAANFRLLVKSASHHWTNILQLIEYITHRKFSKCCNRIHLNILNNHIYIIEESNTEVADIKPNVPKKREVKSTDYRCPKCGIVFVFPRHLYAHLKQSADSIRACYICGLIMSRNELVEHLTDDHDRKPLNCKRCPALFLNWKQYIDHTGNAHVVGACTCGDCGRSFASEAAYRAHQSVHAQRSCPNCDTQFINQTCYSHHIQQCCDVEPIESKSKMTITLKNKQNKKLQVGARGSRNNECVCDYCKKTFSGKKFVAAHIQIVHTKDTHRPCVCCGKLFAAAHMTTHMYSHKEGRFNCQQCGVRVKSKLGFKQHMRLHTGERPYACQYCGERFSASSRRSEHIRNRHKKSEIVLKHACQRCTARFRLPFQLRHHMKIVHEERGSDAVFECNQCKENFASYNRLLSHCRKQKCKMDVAETTLLPRGLCHLCAGDAINAGYWKQLCKQSEQSWEETAAYLNSIQEPSHDDKTLFVLWNNKTVNGASGSVSSVQRAVLVLNNVKEFKRRTRKTKSPVPCICPYCEKRFHAFDYLNDHLKYTRKIFCRKCNKLFEKRDMENHLKSKHNTIVVSCKSCHKLFSNHANAKDHWNDKHGPTARNCQYCGMGYPNERSVTAHFRLHSLNNCKCGRSFENYRCYKYHLMGCKWRGYKSDMEIYTCDYCGAQYSKKPSLKMHIVHKHLCVLPFVCPTCGKRASTKAHLKSHQQIHAKERKIMECSYCGAKFRTDLGYKLHMRIHSGDRPYKCEMCDQTFLSASRRLDHVKRRHKSTMEMAHACGKCPASFIRPWELRKHYLAAHNCIVEVKPVPRMMQRCPNVSSAT